MSEYWKSTPKYWCKHCKTFVRDSKLEKANHEATPKHQGNLQRFLRDLHRNNERETREMQRGKDEVARLKGIMGESVGPTDTPPARKPAISASNDSRQATASDRKRKLQQLAEMGIAVPEEARREMAMAGDWHVQSVTPVYDGEHMAQKEEQDEEMKSAALAVGVHKRKFEGDEEKEEAGERVVKRGWGSTTRTWESGDKDDLDSLLSATKATNQDRGENPVKSEQEESLIKGLPEDKSRPSLGEGLNVSTIKTEDDNATSRLLKGNVEAETAAKIAVKSEIDSGEPSIVFKKRKSKQTR